MGNSGFNNRLLLNALRCGIAALPTFLILHFLLPVIKVDGQLPGAFQLFLVVFGAYIVMALFGLIFSEVPIIFYIVMLPGYFVSDFVLHMISKSSPQLFGGQVPKITMAVCL
ncbi:MAG: hypothetical protein LW688_04315 [Cryomorphaceae bacterium]|jgi:hypothetical protein|nr:hypothetical protein [Cryomorphaceae bacterium]